MKRSFRHITSILAMVLAAGALCINCNDSTDDLNDPVCITGNSCDDGDPSTDKDVYDISCRCIGEAIVCFGIGDADGDGVCADVDCDDNDPDITATDEDGDGVCGDIDCDDSDPDNTDTDADGDGFCASEDCSDNAPSYYPGASCDDGNPGTINDIVTEDCNCIGSNPYGTMTDPRDGQEYRTIEISGLTWMADNLNYEMGTSWCYDEDPANCEIFGRMYNYQTSLDVCPEGWHLPTQEEFIRIFNHLGGLPVAGGPMKGDEYWEEPNVGATNSSGFSAMPAGCYSVVTASFNMLNRAGFWWSSTETGQGNNIYAPSVNATTEEVLEPDGHPGDGYSVRCIRD